MQGALDYVQDASDAWRERVLHVCSWIARAGGQGIKHWDKLIEQGCCRLKKRLLLLVLEVLRVACMSTVLVLFIYQSSNVAQGTMKICM